MDLAFLRSSAMRIVRGVALPTAAELTNYTGSVPATAPAPTSNPWLGAFDATTPILGVGGAADVLRIRCILRDGVGQPLIGGVLRIDVASAVTGGLVEGGTVSINTDGGGHPFGTILAITNNCNAGFTAAQGGSILVACTTQAIDGVPPGKIDLNIDFGSNGAKVLVLDHAWHRINASFTLP